MLEHPSNPLILMHIELTLAVKLDHISSKVLLVIGITGTFKYKTA